MGNKVKPHVEPLLDKKPVEKYDEGIKTIKPYGLPKNTLPKNEPSILHRNDDVK